MKNNDQDQNLGEVLNHEYDGIQELNNPLPRWWLITFYGAIIFSIVYVAYYQFMGGPSSDQLLKEALSGYQALQAESSAQVQADGGSDFNEILKNPEQMALGKEKYQANCAQCHGPSGEGLVGPNLTDEFWIHKKGTPEDILSVIQEGVLEKGMPPWKAVLPPQEILAISAFVHSLKGTNPANAKEAQGEKIQ